VKPLPAAVASTSQVTSARSGFSPLARNPPYIPAALNPFAAVTPPGIYPHKSCKLGHHFMKIK